MNAEQRAASGMPAHFALRVALVFSAPMFVNGIALPYFPVWLHSLNLTASEISTILAVPMVVRVIAGPLVSMAADRLDDRTRILIISAVLSLATAIALFFTSTFWPIALIFGLQGAVYAAYVPVTEAVILTGVRRWGFDYGFLRLWGSLAFIGSSVLAGWLIGLKGGAMVLPAMAGGFVLCVLAALIAPKTGKAPPKAQSGHSGRSVLLSAWLIALLVGHSLSQGSHAMLFAFSAIDWGRQGFSGTQIGVLWAAGVLAEVIVFWYSRRIQTRFSPWELIMLGIVVAVARWTATPFAMSFAAAFALQCLHAFTFATCHLGVQSLLVRHVAPSEEASAQGLFFFFNGGFLALATFASGPLYSALGLNGYFVMAAISALGLAFVLYAWLAQPQRAGSGGATSESR